MGWWNKVARENKGYEHAEVKFNGGTGACLCNRCSVILSYGVHHEDVDRYCGECYNKLADAFETYYNDREMMAKHGENGYEWVNKNLPWSKIQCDWQSQVKDILS